LAFDQPRLAFELALRQRSPVETIEQIGFVLKTALLHPLPSLERAMNSLVPVQAQLSTRLFSRAEQNPRWWAR
jgi:hypothetical protein